MLLLWALQDAGRLSAQAKRELQHPGNTVSVSVISFWEVGLKFGLGKLALHGAGPRDIPGFVADAGWRILPLPPDLAESVGRLALLPAHRDPFDRLLIRTAISGNFYLASGNESFADYAPHGLRICW